MTQRSPRNVPFRTVRKLTRLGTPMEPLESRTLMSTALLATPTAVTATAAGPSTIDLRWTETSSTATGYTVLRSTGGGSFATLSHVAGAATTTYADTTVKPNQTYAYKVEAVAPGKVTAAASSAPVKTPLAAPSAVSATLGTGEKVTVSWTDNDTTATGYYLLRSTNGGAFSQIANLTGKTAKTTTDSTVTSGQSYRYEVEAYSTANTSAVTAPVALVTPLATPSNAAASASSSSLVHVTWTDNDASATGYIVLRSVNGTTFTALSKISTAGAASFDDKTVVPFTTYYYEIEATTSAVTSAASGIASAKTPLAIPTAVSASTLSGNSIKLTWTDNDSTATGYTVLRATDGGALMNVATLSSGSANSFTDTVTSGHSYSYSLIATAGSNSSGMASLSTAVTPLVAPSGLTATALTATSIKLTWTNNDPAAKSYKVLRSTDGSTFTLLATLNSATANTATDTTALANHTYYYEVQAVNGNYSTSATSAAASATTPMLSPTKLTATVAGSSINLTWTDNDPTATGYTVLRSTDGVNYTTLATLNSGTASSYADTTATAGQTYYYQVQATAGSASSAVSAATSAMVTAPTTTGTVTVTTRYTDELVITSTGKDDSISISETGTTLSITADGTTVTDAAPAAGVFLYTRGGTDGITIGQSVTSPLTVETIDGAVDDITSAGTDVTAWIDSTDIYTGTGTVHSVANFAGNVAKTTGAALADPKDAGKTEKISASLFGTGPVAGDINQGGVGDCYFLSSLAALAGTDPAVIEQSAVDMGDGTYTVQFYNSQNKPVYVRVSNDISTGNYWGYAFARPGATGDIWGLIMEKAFADFRTGANTYASISSGWMGEVYSDLGIANDSFVPGNYSESQLYTMLSTDLADGKAVTLGTYNPPDLVGDHAYTLVSCSIDANGVTSYVVRNPWGVSGDSLENNEGYATLTYAQMIANFVDGCQAT